MAARVRNVCVNICRRKSRNTHLESLSSVNTIEFYWLWVLIENVVGNTHIHMWVVDVFCVVVGGCGDGDDGGGGGGGVILSSATVAVDGSK